MDTLSFIPLKQQSLPPTTEEGLVSTARSHLSLVVESSPALSLKVKSSLGRLDLVEARVT